jgi:hypothetical protein
VLVQGGVRRAAGRFSELLADAGLLCWVAVGQWVAVHFHALLVMSYRPVAVGQELRDPGRSGEACGPGSGGEPAKSGIEPDAEQGSKI